MNRSDFQILAVLRAEDARALLDGARYEGSYYLAGYAIECALKACIAKQTKLYDFPPPKEVVGKIYTHNLETLLDWSQLRPNFDADSSIDKRLATHWGVVKKWSEQFRYNLNITEPMARDMYTAIADSNHGVLTWLKRY